MSGLNDQDARALTYLACRIRKETHGARVWDEAGVYAEVKQLIGHSLPLTAERVLRHASDVEAKTPGAIRRPFVPDAPVAGVRFPARAGDPDECRIHPGEHGTNCRACAADRLAGDDTQPTRHIPKPDPEQVTARVLELKRNVVPLRPARATDPTGDAS